MNKQKLFKELREELMVQYHAELKNVQSLLDSGPIRVHNEKAQLMLRQTTSLPAVGEAGKVFREEALDAISLILERYARNLAKEIEDLGLK